MNSAGATAMVGDEPPWRAVQRRTMFVHSSCHCCRFAAISAGSIVSGSVGHHGELGELGRQRCVDACRVDEQVQRQLVLERRADEEVDQLAGLGLVLRAAEHTGELDLAEARRLDDSGRRIGARRVGEDHLGRRARAVADDERPLAGRAGRRR